MKYHATESACMFLSGISFFYFVILSVTRRRNLLLFGYFVIDSKISIPADFNGSYYGNNFNNLSPFRRRDRFLPNSVHFLTFPLTSAAILGHQDVRFNFSNIYRSHGCPDSCPLCSRFKTRSLWDYGTLIVILESVSAAPLINNPSSDYSEL